MPVSFCSPVRTTLTVYQTALAALRAGISFIPIVADGSKRPALRWKAYQYQHPTLVEAVQWFSGKNAGIALITGRVSGGLEMLDFDSLADYEQFCTWMRIEGFACLLDRLERGYQERSPRGIHLYYRCEVVEGNKPLARRPCTTAGGRESKIETRGEGGYSIAAPSAGRVHPSGQPYRVLGGSLATIPTITPQDRGVLHAVARALDELPRKAFSQGHRSHHPAQHGDGRRPGTIFNERVSWADVLEAHGWTWVKRIGEEDFWRRPGKASGISATTNYEGSDYLYVFSTSTIFEPRVGISKFAAYTFLEHHGDFSAATKALVAQGYGEQKP